MPPKTLDRVFSKAGIGSRVEARAWIEAGRVGVNGRTVRNVDHWVDMDRDRITLDGRSLQPRAKVYLLLHKPAGFLTTYRDPRGRPTVYELIQGIETFVSPIGRLDLDTSGLLLLTNDTQLAEHVTNPQSHVPKTYLVTASRALTDASLQQLRDGVELSDGPTRPAMVRRRSPTQFEITITEGRNRQVRRMVEALDASVIELVRTRIGSIGIGDLEPGRWRFLTAREVASIGHRRPSHSPRRGSTADRS